MKKKQKKASPFVPMPLFDAALQPVTHVHEKMQSSSIDETPLLPPEDENFQPIVDSANIPLYQEVAPTTLLMQLNPPQRQAVTTTRGPVLVFAGPGSGKTRVITHRIAYLISHDQISPKNILAMTFTNKAASEMRERLERMVGEHARDLVVTTFHSLCARILRRSQAFLLRFGLTPSFSIADEDDQERLLREIIRTPAIDLSGLEDNQKTPGAFRDQISRVKGNMQSPDDVEDEAIRTNNYSLHLLSLVYREYHRQLRKQNFLDFEDLLIYTVSLLQSETAIRSFYQQRWKYIHVDEFQDCNYPQYLIMRLLALGTEKEAHGYRNVCIVGDDDQMIYTWRGASADNLARFEQDFPEHAVIFLEQNYRSTKTIVEAASSVVKENQSRREKHL